MPRQTSWPLRQLSMRPSPSRAVWEPQTLFLSPYFSPMTRWHWRQWRVTLSVSRLHWTPPPPFVLVLQAPQLSMSWTMMVHKTVITSMSHSNIIHDSYFYSGSELHAGHTISNCLQDNNLTGSVNAVLSQCLCSGDYWVWASQCNSGGECRTIHDVCGEGQSYHSVGSGHNH